MARLRDSWRTSLPASQQPRNPQSESIARTPYQKRVNRPSNGTLRQAPQYGQAYFVITDMYLLTFSPDRVLRRNARRKPLEVAPMREATVRTRDERLPSFP